MNTLAISHVQRGAVLVVSMLFLLVVTIISVVAARNSTFSTKMASNIQDAYSSFQSAEAGVLATLLLARSANDPFQRLYVDDPFVDFDADKHPLRDLNGGTEDMTVHVYFSDDTIACPPMPTDKATSENLFSCEYYRIDSRNEAIQRARTQVDMGVVKTVLKNGQL